MRRRFAGGSRELRFPLKSIGDRAREIATRIGDVFGWGAGAELSCRCGWGGEVMLALKMSGWPRTAGWLSAVRIEEDWQWRGEVPASASGHALCVSWRTKGRVGSVLGAFHLCRKLKRLLIT